MPDAGPSVLTAWANFYVITGSSAAALTGLQFVVITLMAGERSARPSRDAVAAFGTPTILHFCAALLVSAVLSAPWPSLVGTSTILGLTGLCGAGYTLRVAHHARRQTRYRPDLEDWVWYAVLPLVGYTVIGAAAIRLPAGPTVALFALAGVTVLLLFIGIHNAWDAVTYHVIERAQRARDRLRSDAGAHVIHRSGQIVGGTATMPRPNDDGGPPSVM
jgi:hypothetical protein